MEKQEPDLSNKRILLQAALEHFADSEKPQDHDALNHLKEISEYRAILERTDHICALLQKEWEIRQQFTPLLKELTDTSDPETVKFTLNQLYTLPIAWKEKVDALIQIGTAFSERGVKAQADQIWVQAERICQSNGRDEYGQLDFAAKGRLAVIYSATGAWEKTEHLIATINGSATPTELQTHLGMALAHAGFWEDAERICTTIAPLWKQAEAWGNLGLLRVQREECEQAKMLWEKAEQVAAKCKFRWHQVKSFAELGAILAEAGENEWAKRLWEKAEKICSSIKTESSQVLGFCSVATSFLHMGEQIQAKRILAVAERIYTSDTQKINGSVEDGWHSLCLEFAEAGCWEEAEHICANVMATNTPNAELHKKNAQYELAIMLAQANFWEKAEQIADSLPLGWRRATLLSHVSIALSQMGEREQANRLWKKVVQLCAMISTPLPFHQSAELGMDEWQWDCFKQISAVLAHDGTQGDVKQVLHCIRDEWQRQWILNELAATLTQMGEWNEAYQTSELLPNEWQRRKAFSKLSVRLAQVGLWPQAERASAAIEDAEEQASNLIEISGILVQAGDMEDARSCWEKVQQVCAKVEYEKTRSHILRMLGEGMLRTHSWREAEQTYLSIPEPEERNDALSGLVLAVAQEGLWQEAERMCSLMSRAESKASIYGELARELTEKNKREQARRWWEKAVQEALSISEKIEQALALSQLGITRHQIGEEEQAQHLWKQAKEICMAIRNKGEQTEALEYVNKILNDYLKN